ncbi:FAD-dependent oxidoreductase [Sphingosinicella soli]|uniref:Choline dehydrogenase-like flavoprotein n=1 Tax=Sphingosinicella soli TaxID=333708 RepID=A0A7W7B3G2_9SPHN|nr:GMC family oxidoreductase [Sphingosinicella soli]MBB4632252.1 choline dehydrogenase-like flavoprotein [Sphingosinicella soli]
MYFDLETDDIPPNGLTEVCIIGAGAAGIGVARRLLAQGRSVTLLESGGIDYEAETARLGAGRNVGEPYYDLEDSRLRFFGGTTAIWGGRCAELDPIDFERRDWVPHSGWPISRETLEPYYREAWAELGFPQGPDTAAAMKAAGVPLPDFDPARLSLGTWQFDERFNRFTFDACAALRAHPRCTIVTHATVTEIASNAAGAVTHVDAKSLGGRAVRIHARYFVLAAGGLENPRLLLANRLGNDRDLVGRFFMEHPHARGGRVVEGDAWALLKAFARPHRVDGRKVAALVTPSAARQAERRVLNTSMIVAGRQPADARQFIGMRAYSGLKHKTAPTRAGRGLWMLTKRAASFVQERADPLRPWLLHKTGGLDLALLVRAEQAPNPDSRVMLDTETDALGVPRITLDWRLSELDIESVAVLVEDFGHELERLGMGRVETAQWLLGSGRRWTTDPLISSHPIGGYHHIGTTRMASSPAEGVCDPEGRVHGTANLYVAGSSLFPTSGWANPTLTIIALAARTGDAIGKRMAHTAPLQGVSAPPPAQRAVAAKRRSIPAELIAACLLGLLLVGDQAMDQDFDMLPDAAPIDDSFTSTGSASPPESATNTDEDDKDEDADAGKASESRPNETPRA